MTRYEWRGVLAGAYANDKAMARAVDHLVDVETGAVLCKRVKPERMCDIGSPTTPKCPKCEERVRKKAPYPWCMNPCECLGIGHCPRNPNCGD